MTKIAIRIALALTLLSVHGVAQAGLTSAQCIAKLEGLNKSLNAAKYIRFKAIVRSNNGPSQPESVTFVRGVVQAPNYILATAVDPAVNSTNGCTLACDGKSYWAVSSAGKEYAAAPAPTSAFEPDVPSAAYFIRTVLSDRGSALMDVSEQFFPADFNVLDDPVTPGQTRSVLTYARSGVVNGVPCTDIVQRLTTSHNVYLLHTLLAISSGRLLQLAEDKLSVGMPVNEMTITFLSLVPGWQPLPASEFEYKPATDMQAYVAPASPGSVAPNFTVSRPDGSQVHLSDYAGKVVLIDFWATWCGPCQVTLPDTNQLAAKYQPLGVVFLPVCTWDTKTAFDKYVASHNTWNLQWVLDPATDESKSIAASLYAVSGIPTQFVIGKDGKIDYVCFADSDAGKKPLVDAIENALSAPPVTN